MTKITNLIYLFLLLGGALALGSRSRYAYKDCITAEQESEKFAGYDADGNGVIGGDEFITAKCGLSEDPEECKRNFTKLTRIADGNFSLILPAFSEYDDDMNNELDTDEFHAFANVYECDAIKTNFVQSDS